MPENEPNGTPAASDAAGQRPTDGTQPTVPANDPASQTPAADGTTQDQQSVRDEEAKLRSEEAARYRNELRAAQKRIAEIEAERAAEKKAAEEANLSELEKAQRRISEYEAKESQATLQAQERITRAEVRAAAAAMGLNPQLAARVVDYASITYDDNGDPTNVADLLKAAIAEYGLNATPAASAQPQAPAVGPTNPPRQTGPLTISATQYSDPTFRAQYMRDYGEDLLAAMNKGKVKLV